MTPIPVLSATEAATWDSVARTQYRIPSRVLMEAAGRAVAQVIVREFPAVITRGVLVAAGAGNNGGDGWVVARALHAAGVPVWVSGVDPKTDDAIDNRALARVDGVREIGRDEPWPAAAVAVDALLGTGAAGPARGDVLALAQRLVAYGATLVAVDGPTGLDLSSGEPHGPVRAALSVTFGGPRRGHLLAREWCGKIVVVDIGFPPAEPSWPILVTDAWAGARLPKLTPTMHKGDRGRVTVVGGSNGMTGAALHAARAALAAGAGLVKLVAGPETIQAARASLPDVLTLESALGPELEPAAAEALEWADALVVGPGLGRAPARAPFLQAVLARRPLPTVVDADALALFVGPVERPVVLTPHLGEFRAQFGDELADAAANDRWGAAAKAAQKVKGTVLLKGVPTVIADLRGPIHVVASGNPGLATGGSGDLLAGFIGAFLARGSAGPEAAALGAHVLGRAAEHGARQWTARSLRPADVLAALPDIWRAWASAKPLGPPVLAELELPETE
ncbi:MAG: bifunctional ADP-dependent NAD(P)H-hydrate dehydratase/NAD(P)H-hydrate epimerase [Gemmatimonadetes bacterium]|nr:MAG: bifunctional ADP-dependent NAD(P)H-hydrate dehydratase/NAD(P)H-hydrate epimerase [Gemmatimonadota bacterium]PYP28188.1 MAG: bifunctional ADP-dependent NAD(P)H-hydrate dehydratase/NAD(P)H-hydrate epimerase [Gemmatimonadota bacterium]